MYKIKETTDERLTFLVTIPVHEGCGESSEIDLLGSETHNESSERKKLVRRQPQKVRREMLIQLKMYIIV